MPLYINKIKTFPLHFRITHTDTRRLPKDHPWSEHSSGSHNGVTRSVDTRDGQLLTKIPHKMSDSVKGMEHKWECHGGLGGKLGGKWQAGKCRNKHGGVKWHTKERSSSVTTGQSVKGTGHSDTSDSVEWWQNHGDLWSVDGQVRRHWTVFTLVDKKLLFLVVGHLDGGGGVGSHGAKGGGSKRESCKCCIVSNVIFFTSFCFCFCNFVAKWGAVREQLVGKIGRFQKQWGFFYGEGLDAWKIRRFLFFFDKVVSGTFLNSIS